MKTTSIWTIIYMILLPILFTSCTTQPQLDNVENLEGSTSENTLSALWEDSSKEMDDANITQLVGTKLYTAEWQYDMEQMRQSDTRVYCKDRDAQTDLIAEFPEEELNCFAADEEGSVYYIYGKHSQDGEYICFLRKDTSQGDTEYCEEIQDQEENIVLDERSLNSIYHGAVDGQGQVCFFNHLGQALVFNAEGQYVSAIDTGWASELGGVQGVVNSRGSLFLYHIENGTVKLCGLDMGAGSLAQEVVVPIEPKENAGPAVFSGYGEGLLVSDGASLWSYIPEEGELQKKILDWDDKAIDLQPDYIQQIGVAGKGRYTVLYLDPVKNETVQVVIEEKQEDETDARDTIILGCMDFGRADTIEQAVKGFNKKNQQYQVKLKKYDRGEYSQYYKDLLQGNGPDLFELSGMPQEMLAEKGILEDLGPYFEQSGVISMEQLMPCVREAGMSGEKMVCVFPEFYMLGKIVEKGYTQDGGWTADDFFALGDKYPQAQLTEYDADPFSVMLNYLPVELGSYVDWPKQESHFDSIAFQQLLTKLKTNSQRKYAGEQWNTSAEKLVNKEVLTLDASVVSIPGYLEIKDAFSGAAEFAGYPNPEGKPWYRLVTNEKYGMNSASRCKEGAWAFLEFLFTEEYQKDYTTLLPAKKSAFDAYLEGWPGNSGETADHTVYFRNTYTGERKEGYPEFGEEDKEKFRSLAENAHMQESFSIREIQGTVQEEVEAFFYGEKTAEEAAKIIQNRVSLFLTE